MILSRDIRILTKLHDVCVGNAVQLRCRHVAALACRNTIVSIGMNKAHSDPGFYRLSRSQDKQYIHAEYDCLNNMPEDCSKYALYVMRVDRRGKWAMSKPCPICERAIRERRIARVVHTINNGVREMAIE